MLEAFLLNGQNSYSTLSHSLECPFFNTISPNLITKKGLVANILATDMYEKWN